MPRYCFPVVFLSQVRPFTANIPFKAGIQTPSSFKLFRCIFYPLLGLTTSRLLCQEMSYWLTSVISSSLSSPQAMHSFSCHSKYLGVRTLKTSNGFSHSVSPENNSFLLTFFFNIHEDILCMLLSIPCQFS